jgi:hypothetical protein
MVTLQPEPAQAPPTALSREGIMTIKYAYIHPYTREYLYTESKEELQNALAQFAAQVYTEHYCNGALYTLVEAQEDGSEKWFSPTGESILSPAEIEQRIKHLQSFANAGEIPVSILGG